jgi:hypothetical protein
MGNFDSIFNNNLAFNLHCIPIPVFIKKSLFEKKGYQSGFSFSARYVANEFRWNLSLL